MKSEPQQNGAKRALGSLWAGHCINFPLREPTWKKCPVPVSPTHEPGYDAFYSTNGIGIESGPVWGEYWSCVRSEECVNGSRDGGAHKVRKGRAKEGINRPQSLVNYGVECLVPIGTGVYVRGPSPSAASNLASLRRKTCDAK